MIEICRWTVSAVYGTTANVAGVAIQNFQIGPSLSNRISKLRRSLRFTHISGHPSAVGRAQDSESSSVKDQRSTTEPRDCWHWVTD